MHPTKNQIDCLILCTPAFPVSPTGSGTSCQCGCERLFLAFSLLFCNVVVSSFFSRGKHVPLHPTCSRAASVHIGRSSDLCIAAVCFLHHLKDTCVNTSTLFLKKNASVFSRGEHAPLHST